MSSFPEFFEQHNNCLLYSPDRVTHTLQMVADLLDVPVASKEMQEVITGCGEQLFMPDPAVLHRRISFFCQEFKGGQHAAETALKQDIFWVLEGTMGARAAELKAMLGWTQDELMRCLNACPQILTRKPATVANNIQKLQTHSFTSDQAVKVYTSRPASAGYEWSSPLNVEKIEYLMLILQLTTAEIASKPALLATSLAQKLGPLGGFIYRSQAVPPDEPLAVSGFASYVTLLFDAKCAARLNVASVSPPLIYDADFKQHWQHRWGFLRHEMELSVADISACRALLYTSVPNTLAPSWRFLTVLQDAQAGFKAADHITALATLSDEHFSQAFIATVGSVYDDHFKQHAQGVPSKS